MHDNAPRLISVRTGILSGIGSAGLIAYILGFFIVNRHLATVQIYDFSALQPRMVAIGITFLTYTAVKALPFAILAWFCIEAWGDAWEQYIVSVAEGFFAALAASAALAFVFFQFLIPCIYVDGYRETYIVFWGSMLRYHPVSAASIGVGAVLLLRNRLATVGKRNHFPLLAAALLIFGISFELQAYTSRAYRLIDSSVGGGALRVVDIQTTLGQHVFLHRTILEGLEGQLPSTDRGAIPTLSGPWVLWYLSDTHVYIRWMAPKIQISARHLNSDNEGANEPLVNSVTADAEDVQLWESRHHRVIAIPRQNIDAVIYLPSHIVYWPRGDITLEGSFRDAN